MLSRKVWGRKGSSFFSALNRPDRWGLFLLYKWTNLSCHRRGSREGGKIVLLWLFLFQTIPSTFPNRPYFSLICRKKQAHVVCEWLNETGFLFFSFSFFFFPLCLVRKAVGCGLHVLYITDICHAGISNSNPCETFIPYDLAWQRQEVQKKGPYCSQTGPPSISVLERSEQRWKNSM